MSPSDVLHIYYVGYFSFPAGSAHTKFSEVLKYKLNVNEGLKGDLYTNTNSNTETVLCCFNSEFAFTITSTETPNTSHGIQGTAHRGLQQSIEVLYLSVRQRKQTLYRQNGITTEYNRLIYSSYCMHPTPPKIHVKCTRL